MSSMALDNSQLFVYNFVYITMWDACPHAGFNALSRPPPYSALLLNFDEGLFELIMVFPADWNDFMLVLQVALGYFLHIHVLVIIILAMAAKLSMLS